ncbi:MAG: reverse transcriptase/maturase family protein [Candidatus Paceibacterota bacterium]|jgi:retron-type reverse transcriptase
MKAFNNLFPQVCFFNNIHLAYLKARKNKRYKKDILMFSLNLEDNLLEIKRELEDGTYKHGAYREFIVEDSKKRLLKAPIFKDRVVHHALCNIIETIFEKTFIFDSYACRKNKGTHRAIKRLNYFLKNNKDLYCLKCDVSKYFDSVNHVILLSLIKKKIKDKRIIWLIEEILTSSFSKKEGTGIPIGNLTSQLFANIYLSRLDYFAKNLLREKMYLRYMDDFLFLGGKHRMRVVAKKSSHFLFKELKLEINSKKSNVFPAKKGIDFLGYVVFEHHILLRKSTVKRFLKKSRDAVSFNAYARHANSYLLRRKLNLLPIIKQN